MMRFQIAEMATCPSGTEEKNKITSLTQTGGVDLKVTMPQRFALLAIVLQAPLASKLILHIATGLCLEVPLALFLC